MTEMHSDNSPNISSSAASGTETTLEAPDLQELLTKLKDIRPLESVKEVYNQYKTIVDLLLVTLGVIIGAQILLAVLQVINHIPLLAPVFEIIGIGFTIRYTIDSEGRAKLFQGIGDRWNQIVGKAQP